jgi:PAS domain S-box-containing protein
MERTDLDQWRAREVARLLTLVETQRRYYQEIVASIPVGLLVLSSDLGVILANAAIRNIFGWTSGESMRRRLDAWLPVWLLDRIEVVLKTGVPQLNLMLDTEGEHRRRVRIGILAIRNWDDESAREALLTIEDLTGLEAPPAEATAPAIVEMPPALAQISAPGLGAAELIDHLGAVIWALKIASKEFVFVNQEAEKLLGFPAQHWTEDASFWRGRIHPLDRDAVLESYQRAIDRREAFIAEFRALTSDGRLLWVRETARLLFDGDGNPEFLVGITVNVTERRLLERQLAQSERVEAVTKLASRMAHDLNNMLMILTGYGEELLNGLPTASSLRADVQEVLGAAERMSGLTSQLLAFARRQSAALDALALEAALNGLAIRLTAAAGPDVLLELKPSSEHNYVQADLGQLEQVLATLVKHVARTMLAGASITLETSRIAVREQPTDRVAPLKPGEYLVVSITAPRRVDDPDAHPVSFECFLNGRNPSDDSAALAQAYGMVRQWGGDLAVLDDPAEHSGFRVYLERIEISPPEVPETAAEPEPVAAPEPQLETVLVVEDETGIRTLVRKILRRQGYQVIEASNGEEALLKTEEHGAPINLVITDMMMPGIGGRELVERLHRQDPRLKVLFVSGYTDDNAVYARDLPPGTGFLQKPFTLGSLLEKVKEILSAR